MDRRKLRSCGRATPPARPGRSRATPVPGRSRQVFAGTDRRPKPYEGVSTSPWCAAAGRCRTLGNLGGLDVALVGVPMDLGVTNRAGARLGPRAVRAVERIGPYEHALRVAPDGRICAVADIGDVPMRSRFSLEQCHADIEAFFTQVVRGRRDPARGRRRSFDHLPDPEGARPRPAGRHGAYRRPLRHRRAPSKAPSSITADRSGRRCSPACSTPNARSRSASAAAPNICGSSPTTAA